MKPGTPRADARDEWDEARRNPAGPAPADAEPSPTSAQPFRLTPKSIRQLLADHPELRQPVVHGLLRRGETLNCIAAPKTGKSWLVLGLAFAVATGRTWLDSLKTEPGDVLIIDNELHGETIANRIPTVARAMNIELAAIADRVEVVDLRGRLCDLRILATELKRLPRDRFRLVALDAFYRFLPEGTDENDNGAMAALYNLLDDVAGQVGCAFVLVHHTSKGSQSGKLITDVGAGAGVQSRAADSHLVLRPHAQDGVICVAAEVRSWPRVESFCLRWDFPVWRRDDSCDPTDLRQPKSTGRKNAEPKQEKPAPKTWTPEEFVAQFVRGEPLTKVEIVNAAVEAGATRRHAQDLFVIAESRGLVHQWSGGGNTLKRYASVPPPAAPSEDDGASVCARARPPTPPRGRGSGTGAGKKKRTQTQASSKPGAKSKPEPRRPTDQNAATE
ncbi:MAG: AAA family ATPase [Vicinamibacterales bacterium]